MSVTELKLRSSTTLHEGISDKDTLEGANSPLPFKDDLSEPAEDLTPTDTTRVQGRSVCLTAPPTEGRVASQSHILISVPRKHVPKLLNFWPENQPEDAAAKTKKAITSLRKLALVKTKKRKATKTFFSNRAKKSSPGHTMSAPIDTIVEMEEDTSPHNSPHPAPISTVTSLDKVASELPVWQVPRKTGKPIQIPPPTPITTNNRFRTLQMQASTVLKQTFTTTPNHTNKTKPMEDEEARIPLPPTDPNFRDLAHLRKRFGQGKIPEKYQYQGARKIPPLTLFNVENSGRLASELNVFTRFRVLAINRKDKTLLQTHCLADHEAIISLLSKKGDQADFFWHQPKGEKSAKFVIRGLSPAVELDSIRRELEEEGITPRILHRVTRKVEDGVYVPTGTIKVEIENSPAVVNNFQNLTALYSTRIYIERQRNNIGHLPRCQRCQGWDHTRSRCRRPLNCAWCSDSHFIQDCPNKNLSPKCINCKSSNHPASDINCPIPQNILSTRTKPFSRAPPVTLDLNKDFPTLPNNRQNFVPAPMTNPWTQNNVTPTTNPTNPTPASPRTQYQKNDTHDPIKNHITKVLQKFLEDIDLDSIIHDAKDLLTKTKNPVEKIKIIRDTVSLIRSIHYDE